MRGLTFRSAPLSKRPEFSHKKALPSAATINQRAKHKDHKNLQNALQQRSAFFVSEVALVRPAPHHGEQATRAPAADLTLGTF